MEGSPVGHVMRCCPQGSPAQHRQGIAQSDQRGVLVTVHRLAKHKGQRSVFTSSEMTSSKETKRYNMGSSRLHVLIGPCFFHDLIRKNKLVPRVPDKEKWTRQGPGVFLTTCMIVLCIAISHLHSPPPVCWHSTGSTPDRRYRSWPWWHPGGSGHSPRLS